MLKDYLREVISIIVGREANEVADLLTSKKHMNEFLLAKKLDLTINQTRNILYKIANYGLVNSIRKKDKKKGWYTYFWKLDVLKALEFLKGILIKRIDQIQNQIKSRETKQFYVCTKCNVEFNEENALLQNFTCSECGNIFTIKDNSGVLRELKKNLTKLSSDLEFVEEEIKSEAEKVEKEREKKKPKPKKVKKKKSARKKTPKKKTSTKKKISRKPAKKKTSNKKTPKKKSTKNIIKKKSKKSKRVKTGPKPKKVVKKKSIKSSSKKTSKKAVKKSSKKVVKKRTSKKKK